MGWTTIYITGKSDFREEVRERIESSRLDVMPGYTGSLSDAESVHDLYWVDERISLKEFKQAIGSKLLWRYRLQFYPTFEALIEEQSKRQQAPALTPDDLALIDEIKASIG
jgi:hypothetical protein